MSSAVFVKGLKEVLKGIRSGGGFDKFFMPSVT